LRTFLKKFQIFEHLANYTSKIGIFHYLFTIVLGAQGLVLTAHGFLSKLKVDKAISFFNKSSSKSKIIRIFLALKQNEITGWAKKMDFCDLLGPENLFF
jgi:hypothetical protein